MRNTDHALYRKNEEMKRRIHFEIGNTDEIGKRRNTL